MRLLGQHREYLCPVSRGRSLLIEPVGGRSGDQRVEIRVTLREDLTTVPRARRGVRLALMERVRMRMRLLGQHWECLCPVSRGREPGGAVVGVADLVGVLVVGWLRPPGVPSVSARLLAFCWWLGAVPWSTRPRRAPPGRPVRVGLDEA
ncbi:hypothetical protein BW730_06520 [Tessaracoccus aquimaris]|uniref:Uncharacterized protein n=1 Tax=Tessaracoccus aquimaris TaxID=1332264 RepID=A0A1Q2CM87_9ACTN|nr:hypothetical protein BW730_06520 [Tessaracoccus aquimaris]